MKTTSLTLMAVLLAGSLFAAPPGKHSGWAETPVKYLMTAQEAAQWNKLTTEAEAEAFVTLFWAKRDPSSTTPVNELKEEFDRRVILADQHFTTKRTRGALTDRGRTLILLGSPIRVGSKGAAAGAGSNPTVNPGGWDGSVRGARGQSASLVWTYEDHPLIKRKNFELMFVDDQGDGQYQLGITPRVDPEAIFMEAANGLIFAPEMSAAPAIAAATPGAAAAAASFRNVGIKEAADQFRSAGKSSEGPGLLTWGQFVTPEGETFVPVQLFLPAGSGIGAGTSVTFFGLIENSGGEVINVYEDDVTLRASARDAYIDKSLLLPAGEYRGTFGLAKDGKVLTMASSAMSVKALDPAEVAISEMIVSNNAFPLPEAQKITDPFAFGGFKVVPKSDAVFSTADDITYFYELRNPGLAETGAPKVQAKILIEGTTAENKPVKLNFPIQEFPAIALPGVKNHYGLALTFPLKDFKPGKYKVSIKVIDSVLKKTYESEKPFEIRG